MNESAINGVLDQRFSTTKQYMAQKILQLVQLKSKENIFKLPVVTYNTSQTLDS